MIKTILRGGLKALSLGWFILGIALGVNWARWEEGYGVLWRSGHGGIKWIAEALRHDKTERLALVVITEKQQYQICSIKDAYVYTELRQQVSQ